MACKLLWGGRIPSKVIMIRWTRELQCLPDTSNILISRHTMDVNLMQLSTLVVNFTTPQKRIDSTGTPTPRGGLGHG
jgi:hypothetical protein